MIPPFSLSSLCLTLQVVLDNTALNRIATERLKKATPTLAELNQLVRPSLGVVGQSTTSISGIDYHVREHVNASLSRLHEQ